MFDHFRLFFFGQNQTLLGVDDVERSTMNDERFYDLQGRILQGQPQRGIYIRNGQKHVVK